MFKVRKVFVAGAGIIFLLTCWGIWVSVTMLPKMQGELKLSGITKHVDVEFDRFARPAIFAATKQDAYHVLGYLTARERMFQMDLMRRKTSGRLAEVLGKGALEIDIWQRHFSFQETTLNIIHALPENQRMILRAYRDGVNAYLQTLSLLPIEFYILGYRPEPWQESDSLLISLSMFQLLNQNATDERMLTVMKKVLPNDVYDFLTTQDDIYNADVLLQGKDSGFSTASVIPAKSIQKINRLNRKKTVLGLVQHHALHAGSNQWVTNKTVDGHAILANDMHLPLAVPNLWYPAELNYADVSISGITLPGVPLIIAGSNKSIAWGYTNAQADVLDLVVLHKNPENEQQYLTSKGWQDFTTQSEIIKVKDADDHIITVKKTQWGPVSPSLLLDQEVALQWTAFYPEAVNLALTDIDEIQTLDKALNLFNIAGLPVLNVVLADKRGQIAWTLTGKIPQRKGFDGSKSVARDSETIDWVGFIATERYPRVINPASGSIVTANNRVLSGQHEFVYGQNFANSFRAHRIDEVLKQNDSFTQENMYHLQLDTKTDFFLFYQQLALSVLSQDMLNTKPKMVALKQAIASWDGNANANSTGLAVLVKFRKKLADKIFSAYMQQCKVLDEKFNYSWYNMDTPLRQLLTQQLPETLPGNGQFSSWRELILESLTHTVSVLQRQFPEQRFNQLQWGKMQSFQITHPFSHVAPWLSFLFDMQEMPMAGCVYCVRVGRSKFAASMRLVVSPDSEENMLLVIPTGQSGHPFSAHYRDQYEYWINGGKPESRPGIETKKLHLIADKLQGAS